MLVRSQVSRSQLIKEARARRALTARLARTDVNVFCEFVLRDEKTGAQVVQEPVHRAWQAEADAHDRLLIWSHIESGKTQQLSIARTLWELGRDQSLRTVILSNTKEQARKVAGVVKQYIEKSDELHEVFPELLPGAPWGEYAFSVKRARFSKDASVQSIGVHGNLLGARTDRVRLDDVLDYENTQTEDQRKALIEWTRATVLGRLTDGARVTAVGTAFHPTDILHHLARQPQWRALRYPVVDEQGMPRWPARWPAERIRKKAEELGPIEAARQLMCEARDDSMARFKRAWIEVALRLGEGTQLCDALQVVPRGYRTYTGVDLAVQRNDKSDTTVLFTIAVDPYGNRSVLSIEAGKFTGPEIVGRIIQSHQRFQSIAVVENNAAQDFILQFARDRSAVPMLAFTTGRQKAHPEFGVESLAVEMANGKWRIPNREGIMHPEVQKWVDEMLFYDPRAHTGDRLMASWFAREGARMGTNTVENPPNLDVTRR